MVPWVSFKPVRFMELFLKDPGSVFLSFTEKTKANA